MPIKPKTIWPALILAASRKDKVIGRTEILVVSIKTKNGFNQKGAPPGRMPAAKLEGELITDDIMRASHNGRANVKVKNRWLEVLKIYGRRPERFIIKISRKVAVMAGANSFKWKPKVRADWE